MRSDEVFFPDLNKLGSPSELTSCFFLIGHLIFIRLKKWYG